jgi:hypothetical protein
MNIVGPGRAGDAVEAGIGFAEERRSDTTPALRLQRLRPNCVTRNRRGGGGWGYPQPTRWRR